MNLLNKITLVASLTGLLATNPVYSVDFKDVPKDHRAYKDVKNLVSKGIFDDDYIFRGKHNVTRYEFSMGLSRLANYCETKDDPTYRNVTRLVTEFSNELALLGADVDALRAKTMENEKRLDSDDSTNSNGDYNLDLLAPLFGNQIKILDLKNTMDSESQIGYFINSFEFYNKNKSFDGYVWFSFNGNERNRDRLVSQFDDEKTLNFFSRWFSPKRKVTLYTSLEDLSENESDADYFCKASQRGFVFSCDSAKW
ncbi:hypothetical protein HOK68_04705 [Candidatus Woesearchaeota archaeon]|jgi:hypothetical protein|nr:hypothetical protein [Candidatus Woesearchaeota archaeon]MBT4387760.1 hypothetical protein [Candidatus Woesearchaeota archaeon]MBT4595579.1 hypothetical protein [Candidatus Woesearchaeota archaeon]MBT5740938.1 hypothetical protein [Candidatus Woesearchaeota archaeon]MBT6506048.1 hypothetical protein [Candidatus Woesearchaeota archaeon]